MWSLHIFPRVPLGERVPCTVPEWNVFLRNHTGILFKVGAGGFSMRLHIPSVPSPHPVDAPNEPLLPPDPDKVPGRPEPVAPPAPIDPPATSPPIQLPPEPTPSPL